MRVGSHHIARCLLEDGWDVAFVSNAASPFHLLRDRSEFRRRLGSFRRQGSLSSDGHLWSMAPFALLTPHDVPLLRSRLAHRNWQRSTIPALVRQVRQRGFGDVDLLYIDSPGQLFWLDEIKHRASAARVMDRMGGFARYADEMRQLETELISRVDVTFYSALDLREELAELGAASPVHLPNGVDFTHFASAADPPSDLEPVPAPVVIYAGAIDKWFDFELVNALTGSMTDVSFVFIGPDRIARERLDARPNVHVLGWRSFDELPAYLQAADVGLIPFDVAGYPALVHAIHPLKLYEYLAAGLPVVARRWDELERIGSPAQLVDDAPAMEKALRAAIDSPPSSDVGVAFAKEADWAARVRAMLVALGLDESATAHRRC